MPRVSKLYKMERAMAAGGAVVWLAVFVLLGITELRCLVWLADGEPRGGSGLATFSVVTIGIAMLALIMAPVVYFLVPLGLTVDLLPEGLKATLGPKLADNGAKGFVKQVLEELEGAMERAGEKYEEKPRENPGPSADGG